MNGKTGALWKKVTSWFGYRLHLIADTDHEVPVAFEVTRASASEPRVLPGMLEELFSKMSGMAGRCADFSADRGLDNAAQKKALWDRWAIRPLIDTRLLWQVEKEDPGYDPEQPMTRVLFPERADVIVHDERGRVSCVCPATGEVRAMAFQDSRPTVAGAAPSSTAARRPPSISTARGAGHATGRAG